MTIVTLQERAAARADLEDLDDEEMDEEDGKAQHARELLELLKEDLEENNGRYGEQYIIDFYKKKLCSMPCQNQGFILDGIPKTFDQARLLFSRKTKILEPRHVTFSILNYVVVLNVQPGSIMTIATQVIKVLHEYNNPCYS